MNKAAPPSQSSIRSFFQPKSSGLTERPPPSEQKENASTVPQIDVQSTMSLTSSSPQAHVSSVTLPPQVSVTTISDRFVQPLRRINSLLLPISYPDSFYKKILEPSTPPNFSRVILWSEPEPSPVGGLICRLDPSIPPSTNAPGPPPTTGTFDIYLQSLVLLSPYRSRGLATAALDAVIQAATEQNDVAIASLYAHVWTANTDALAWYKARGFVREEPPIQGYYGRLKPDSAWIVRRRLRPSDHLNNLIPSSVSTVPPPPRSPTTASPSPQPAPSPTTLTPNRPDTLKHTASYQDRRPEHEWNDLPEDVLRGSLRPSSVNSDPSSRSSSRASGKKKRQYPAAAYGN